MSYKRVRRSTVQLTSLLDLLFVMIFVSLIQQKQIIPVETPAVDKTQTTPKILNVKALFKFYATASNPNIPAGEYLMSGTFKTDTGKLSLGGLSWVNRPKNYDMVPLSGKINTSLGLFEGRIEFQGCEKFTLKRSAPGSSSPIAGEWTGIYRCSQGETGLTLKIE